MRDAAPAAKGLRSQRLQDTVNTDGARVVDSGYPVAILPALPMLHLNCAVICGGWLDPRRRAMQGIGPDCPNIGLVLGTNRPRCRPPANAHGTVL